VIDCHGSLFDFPDFQLALLKKGVNEEGFFVKQKALLCWRKGQVNLTREKRGQTFFSCAASFWTCWRFHKPRIVLRNGFLNRTNWGLSLPENAIHSKGRFNVATRLAV